MSGNYAGIGARLQKKVDKIEITEVISGGPAWRENKLTSGDIILKVRQEKETEPVSILGMRLADAVKLIKGEKGTKVFLTIKKVDGTVNEVSIKRDIVLLEETYIDIINLKISRLGGLSKSKLFKDICCSLGISLTI